MRVLTPLGAVTIFSYDLPMSKLAKLLERLKSKPKDFTWGELTTLLGGLGYREETGGKTGGSRRRFVHDVAPDIFAHKPHPGNIVKAYVVKNVLAALQEGGFI